MRLAVIGSRTFNNQTRAFEILDRFAAKFPVDTVVSGGAFGADSLAETWARAHNIPTRLFLPDWRKFGRRAGFLRNNLIVTNSDAVIAFWDGESRGTAHSLRLAYTARIPVYIIHI